MRFSIGLAAAVLAPLLSVRAENFLINVGENGTLTFTPPSITAQAGDTVAFMFMSKNHSVTQSTFAAPCVKSGVVDSGFQNVPDGQNTQLPQFSFNVTDSTTPLWFFCAQTTPAVHCNKGMVFAVNVNPNSPNSFAAFQAAAMAAGGNGSATNGSSSTGSGSSTTGSGSSTSGSPTDGSSSSGSPTDGSSSSGSPTNAPAPDGTGAPGSTQSTPAGGAGLRAAPNTAAALFLAGVVLAWL